ncbi:4643_t:CDS:1, partial [Acaulospora colombiana]
MGEDRSRSSSQRTRRNSTVTLEYTLKVDSSSQTYRQRTESRASLVPTAAATAMTVKKKSTVVAPATSSTTKDRIYSKPAFNPPQRVKLVSPLYA